jgi:hypothetical protein
VEVWEKGDRVELGAPSSLIIVGIKRENAYRAPSHPM